MIQDNLTVAEIGGVRLIKTERLAGQKYAVKFEESDDIYVSPAVYELAESELRALGDVLRVVELPGRGWNDEKVAV